jgi:hypothetical protein
MSSDSNRGVDEITTVFNSVDNLKMPPVFVIFYPVVITIGAPKMVKYRQQIVAHPF